MPCVAFTRGTYEVIISAIDKDGNERFSTPPLTLGVAFGGGMTDNTAVAFPVAFQWRSGNTQ